MATVPGVSMSTFAGAVGTSGGAGGDAWRRPMTPPDSSKMARTTQTPRIVTDWRRGRDGFDDGLAERDERAVMAAWYHRADKAG